MSNYYSADNSIHPLMLVDEQEKIAQAQAEGGVAADASVAAEDALTSGEGGVLLGSLADLHAQRVNTPSPALSRTSSHHSSSGIGIGGAVVPPLSFAGISAFGPGGTGPNSATGLASAGAAGASAGSSASSVPGGVGSSAFPSPLPGAGPSGSSSSACNPFVSRSRRCFLGVCAMDKKTRSKPMTQILDRLRAYGEFQIIIFGDRLILDDSIPVSEWPTVHCLISFTSKGFPLSKVIEYVRLRKPFCVNDIPSQVVLENRYDIYNILERNNIPTPRHLYVDRSRTPLPVVEEHPDYIVIDGVRLDKPLVEKPYDGEDHNVTIYYGTKQGGGSRRLFRKIGNRSSRFYPKVNRLRTAGSYIYESLLLQGKDLKVYTIGPGYAHGEMRKSPVVDGVVARDPDQKELRLLTKLTEEEREIARGICVAFKQNICGFDIIRTSEKSYVIDVNGWSFVKGNMRYYDKCARIMRKMCLNCMKGREALRLDRPLEFVNLSSPAALMPPTPTATTHAQAQAQTATQAQTAQTQQAQVEAIPEEKDGSAAGSSVVNAKDKDSGKEKPSPRNAHVRSVSKDKERESAPAAAAATATAATATAPAEPTTALAVLSAPLPRLDVEKSDASAAGAPTAAASSTSAEGPSSLSSSGMTPAASTSFGSFSLDTSLAPSPAGSPSLSQQPGTLLSLLGSSSNPRGIGVCMASNLIQDTDNNDILLGLVAMFRHADRTPKQKVKLKTKSQTLMQLFEEQRKSAEKEAAAAAGSSTGDTHSSSTKSKHKHQSSKDKDSSKDSKDKSADKEKSADKSSSADKEKSSGGDKDPKDKPKDAGAKSSKDGVGGVIYKDLKWKKKHELKIISDAVKILLVKEQLREKRKKKLMIAQQNAAAAAALAAGQITGAESAAAPEQSEPAEGEVATATATVATAASKASVAAAAAARTAAAAAAAAAEAAWSEDDTDLAAAASAGSPAVPESDLALEDVELEAQIAAEKEKQLKLDAEKDPDYMSKLYQINTVLEKGYGGIKVQLKPKKVEKGKVVQALLIVKWGGEMTHAGVGQARQYAAAFWDDMIPPPYSVSSNSGNSAGQANAPGTTSSGKPGRDGLSASNPAVTSTLANMANFNAESEPSLQTNVSGSPEPGLLLERTPSGGAGSRHTPTPAKHRVNPSMSAAVAAANVVSPTSADSNSNSSITGALAPNANTPAPASALASSDVPVGGAVGEAVDGSASAVQGSLVGASHSPHNSSGSSHEFAYDHNSSLTQSDRHKLKSQLVAARATVSTARSTIEPIPESNEPGTPSKGSASAQNPPPSQQQPPSRKGASTTPPPATPASSKTSSDPAGSPSTAEKGGLGRKMSRSNLLSLTSAQSERSRGGAGAASGDRDNLFSPQSDKSDRFKGGDKDGAGGSGSSSSAGALSGSDPLNAAFASLTSPSSATPTGSAQASTSSAFTSAGKDGEDRMSSFRKQRLAFFQGLQIYSSDEARVVASAEAFYQSTFEHAHGFSDLTLEQSKEREEKKRAQSIRDWIEVSKKTQICHDKEVQRYLDETSQVAENMARAKEGIKFILMAEQSITAAQVTRHMLAQEQIARATSEAERADILKEEEELLRAARAEAETREREEKDQALTLRKQQLEEEHMEKLMDRLGELEEDGMDLERKLMRMNERIAAQARAKKEAAAAAAAAGAGAASPPVPPDDFDSAASDPEFGPGCLSAHLASGTDPKVISELEALLAKIYTKLREAAKKEANGGKKKDKKKHQKTQQPQQPDVVSPLPPAVVPGMEPAIDLSKLSVPGAGVPPQCPVTPPALSPPPSPSSFGPTAMTEWGVRCFPESDSRVLTDRGFLFLGEIEGLLASRQRVLYACYDSAKQCLRYEDGQLVIRSGKAPTHLVDFTERHTQRHWAAEASDAYGIDQQQDRAIGEKANHLSLRVTPDHDMFVQLGSECPSKVLAEELTSNFQCSCRSTAKCPHRCDAIRMLGSATNGLAIQHELGAMSCADVDPQSPVVRLSLRTEAQLDAFFEFYGYWLVNGSLGYAHTGDHSRVRTRGSDVVRVSTVKDTAYLHELLPRCGLVAGLDYSVGKNPNFVTFCISNRAWVAFFDDEYWIKFQEGRRRRAVLSWWVKQRMNKRQLRLLIQGMRLTDGSSAATDQQRERKGEGVFGICTSSVGFRDELMQLYLHAGFSPHFRLHTRKGDRESWWIDYSEESSLWIQRSDVAFKGSSAQAVGEPGAVVRSSPYNRAVDGRLWCVRVQHKDALILAQRAFRSPTGVVTKASRPVIVGNCLRWIGKPRNTLMKLYELLLMLQVQIHSKCEFAEKNTDKEEREKAAAAAATEKAAAEAAAAAATAAAAAAANPDDASVSSTLSSGTPHHRKVSGGSAALLDAGSKGVAGASAGDKQSSASTSAGSSTAAPSDKPATSTTEFEYVYEFDDDLDVEIMGKNFKKSRKEGAVQQRFGIGYLLCHKETLYLMKTRWDNLISSFYDPVSDTFDPTKLPDVYDCVVEGTLVATASGEALPIEKITVGTQVMARAASSAEAPAGGVVPRAVSAVLDRGIRECVELLFSDGRELVCTPDHRILTADGVWTTAAQLVVNESEVAVALAVKAGQVSCGDRVLPFCQVQLIARRAVGLRHVYDLAVPSGKDEFDSFTANGICVHNCIKYDVLHNMEFLSDIRPLYSAIKRVADFVVPNEYGILIKGKWSIGVGIARPLLKRMIDKLESALSPKAPSRVTLYFSSESHIHALRNVLLLSGIALNRTVATTLDAIELNYLSHAVFRLYEDVSRGLDDPLRYYVNVQFSPGAALDPFIFSEEGHTLPVSRPVPVNGRIPFHLFKAIFGSLSDQQPPRGFVQPWMATNNNSYAYPQPQTQPLAAVAVPSTPSSVVVSAPSPRR